MNKRSATILGFVVSSAIPALLQVTTFLIRDIRDHSVILSEIPVSFVVFYLYSIFFAVVFGVPIFLVACRMRLVAWWSTLLAGMLVGALVAIIVQLGNESYVDAFIKYVPAATIAAFVFWLIWKRGV